MATSHHSGRSGRVDQPLTDAACVRASVSAWRRGQAIDAMRERLAVIGRLALRGIPSGDLTAPEIVEAFAEHGMTCLLSRSRWRAA